MDAVGAINFGSFVVVPGDPFQAGEIDDHGKADPAPDAHHDNAGHGPGGGLEPRDRLDAHEAEELIEQAETGLQHPFPDGGAGDDGGHHGQEVDQPQEDAAAFDGV